MSEIPIVEEKKDLFVSPGVFPSSSIMDSKLVIQKPYAVTGCAYETVNAYSATKTDITFQKQVNPNELIDKGLTFSIPKLEVEFNGTIGVFKRDPLRSGEAPTYSTVGGIPALDANKPNLVLNLQTLKTAARPIYNMIQAVQVTCGDGFSINITDVDTIMKMLPYYASRENHEKHLAPEIYQTVAEAVEDQYFVTTLGKEGTTYDLRNFAKKTDHCYDPFSFMSPNGRITSENSTTIDKSSYGAASLQDIRSGDPTKKYLKYDSSNVIVKGTIRDINFCIPHDLFRDLMRVDENALYGLTTIQVTILLRTWSPERVIYTSSELPLNHFKVTSHNVAAEDNGMVAGEYQYGFTFTGIRDVKISDANMVFARRKPVTAVSEAMRVNSNFYLPFNHVHVSRKTGNKTLTRSDPRVTESSGDIALPSVPQYIMFGLIKKPGTYTSGEMSTFAKIESATIVVNGVETTLRGTELYSVSERNGYFGNRHMFANGAGSVCCVNLNDLNSNNSSLLVGANENVNITVSVSGVRLDAGVQWGDGDSNQYDLVVLSMLNHYLVKEGTSFSILNGLAMAKTKELTAAELAVVARDRPVYAGSFFGSLWKGIKAIPSVIGAVGNVANRLTSAINQGTEAYNNVQGSGINRNRAHITAGAYADQDLFIS